MRPARKREEGEYREYSTDAQRSAPRWSAGRVSQDFWDATVEVTSAP